jgi:chemosensory pili system protein ChpA (sensor histidine kinase/response regulator)
MAKILVVDDDPDFIKITRMILQSQNHEVLTAGDGEKGLEVMRQAKPDLVLLDIMMAYILDGLNVRRQMAADKELQDIPVIMVTSLTGERVRSELPSDEYVPTSEWLHKPIDPDNLLKLVGKYLGWHPMPEKDKEL